MRKKEFAARVWSKLIAAERTYNLLRRGDRVLAAVSGGPDSVCLAHYLASSGRRLGIEVAVLHVHHGLRGQAADRDAKFVQKLGAQLNVPVSVVKVHAGAHAKKKGTGIEDAARELRYKVLAKTAVQCKFNKVATGHQLDDQAETILLHLLRGTKIEGLAGIPPRRPLAKGVELIRPLLGLTRTDVTAYIKVHGLDSRLDRSNLSAKYTRNWVRRTLLPLLETRNPQIKVRLAGIAEQARMLF